MCVCVRVWIGWDYLEEKERKAEKTKRGRKRRKPESIPGST